MYYNPSQSPQSRTVCRGRTGYVADTSRNCQVFYNCLADGTVTTSTCPGNFQFDETTQCCKMPHDVNCAGLLDGGGGGQFLPTISVRNLSHLCSFSALAKFLVYFISVYRKTRIFSRRPIRMPSFLFLRTKWEI